MSLMGGLYVGATALKTSSNALNTVAHNLANVDTTGYTRQQVSLATRHYNILSTSASAISYQEVGLGVKYAEVKQVRDYFLDKTYRQEYGREAFYGVSSDTLTDVEDVLGEGTNDSGFSTALSDFWSTVQELAQDPSSSVTQGLFISKAQTMLSQASTIYKSITSYQDNLNTQVKTEVDSINSYGKQLATLNLQIAKIESGGTEHANDLRDQRNTILDSLSQLCQTTYSEDTDGNVSVQIEGTDFVRGDDYNAISLDTDSNGFYTPYWPQDATTSVDASGKTVTDISNAKVFNLNLEISSQQNTDIGKLKSTLLARGDHYATSDDLTKGTDYYNTNIAGSVCMNVEAEFDNLISNIATKVNSVLTGAGYTDGTTNTDNSLFTRTSTSDGWHISNLKINSNYLQTPSLLSMKTSDGSVDYTTATSLKAAFQDESYVLNPNLTQKTDFVDYYDNLVEQVTNSSSVAQTIYSSQGTTVSSASDARQQVVGVSSDEELQHMIEYQNAYNAASRYISTVNDMLNSIITAFGA
jgi:flagellar hook-associated protein 1 FlgK